MVRQALLLLPALRMAVAGVTPPPGVVVDEIKFQFDPIGEYCLVKNYGPASYDIATTDVVGVVKLETTDKTMEACANLCTGTDTCKTWTYFTTDNTCYDITALAPANAPGSVPLVYDGTGKPMTGLAGSCNCPSTANAGTVLTGDNFPAADPSEYANLFQSSAHQPAPLACWPKNDVGEIKMAPARVQRSNQVANTDAKYFAGWCDGMTKQDTLPAGMDCKTACQKDSTCNGYQWVPAGSTRAAGCFWGAGYDCDNAATGAAATAVAGDAILDPDAGMKAERYTRGYVKTIAEITKFRVNGLTRRFDEKAFQMDDPNPPTTPAATATPAPTPAPTPARLLDAVPVPQITDWATTILRCREICESDIWCSVWQVYDTDGTAQTAGCFTESQGGLPYPLVRSATEFVPDATGVKAGAFIQHWYSEDITTTTTTTTAPPPPSRLLPILLGLAGIAALLGVGAYAMGWCSPATKKRAVKAKRALQPAPEPPKEPLGLGEPVPTQPSFLMSAPVMTYSAAPVAYAAPVATMQHQPMTYAAPPTTASYQMVQPQSTMPYASSVVVPHHSMVQ